MPLIVKMPENVISFIIQKRNDKLNKYGFQDIADLVNKEFGIDVTLQTIRYHYNKHKDKPEFQDNVVLKHNSLDNVKSSQVVNPPVAENQSEEEVQTSSSVAKTSAFDFKAFRQKNAPTSSGGFNRKAGDNLTKEDIAKLMGKSE